MAKKIVVFTLIPFVLLVAYVMHHNFNSVLNMQSANQFNSILELESVCKKDEEQRLINQYLTPTKNALK